MLKLVKPSAKYLQSALTACSEFMSNPSIFQIQSIDEMIQILPDNADRYFYKLYMEENGINLKLNYVSQTIFWLVDDEEYIGTFALRHNLTDYLKEIGGHIAYQIKPSKQKQGYATKGLLLCIGEALKIGLEQVLITCKENNIASYKTMQKAMLKMGGREIEPSITDGQKNHRIWIKTQERHNGTIRPLALAIITKDNKILANKGYDTKKNEWFYRLPGGGIDFCEKAEDTLKREFMEENGIEISVGEKLGIVENIFEFNGKKGHEIALVFRAFLSDKDMLKDKIPLLEPEFEGCFTEFIEINSENKIYPQEALDFIKNN